MKINIQELAAKSKKASLEMAAISTEQKNKALQAIMKSLRDNRSAIMQANRLDVDEAKKEEMAESLIDRLSLEGRLEDIIKDIQKVIELADPVGEIFERQTLSNKLSVEKHRTPIGVLGVIYESRPNVTVDISALALKSGNCAILRGGSETLRTNQALASAIRQGISAEKIPQEAIQLIESTEREYVSQLLGLYEYVDLIIPRGSAALQKFCRENSTIPVITGGIGICHLFVDQSANLDRSIEVILNAKVQRPTVCNALDTLLVHREIAPSLIPKVIETLGEKGVAFKLDQNALDALQETPSFNCEMAKPKDWDTEWLGLILGIKVVKNLDEAIEHIHLHSTGHSDGILTEDRKNVAQFIRNVDSAAVYVNASTRFTDGGQLGLGSEVAISTQKLHARGPMGLKELTSYKWVIEGNYQVRK